MPEFLLSVIRFIRLLLSGHQAIAIENAALRLQLVAFQRKRKRPVLTTFDRVFWITLRRWWSGWRRPLFYVQADTRRRLATRALPAILGATVQATSSPWPSDDRRRHSSADRADGGCKSTVACTANPR